MSIDITSWELTKELKEVSGWEPDASNKELQQVGFSLGYLLRKLPKFIGNDRVTIQPVVDDRWDASYDELDGSSTHDCFADTPEDAAAKLAIELFNQHILRKEGEKE